MVWTTAVLSSFHVVSDDKDCETLSWYFSSLKLFGLQLIVKADETIKGCVLLALQGYKKNSAAILANHDFNKWHIGRMCLQGHSRSQTSRRDASICLFGNLSEGYCRRHAHTGCRYTKWCTPAEPLHVYWGQEFISFLLEEKWTVMTRAEKWAARDFILSVCI